MGIGVSPAQSAYVTQHGPPSARAPTKFTTPCSSNASSVVVTGCFRSLVGLGIGPGWGGARRCKRRFLYVVAIDLVKQGLLDEHNRPAPRNPSRSPEGRKRQSKILKTFSPEAFTKVDLTTSEGLNMAKNLLRHWCVPVYKSAGHNPKSRALTVEPGGVCLNAFYRVGCIRQG